MNKIKFFLLPLLLFSCRNNLNNIFFKDLFELPYVDLTLQCSNNQVYDDGKGARWEVYLLSNDTYNEFIKKFQYGDTISAPHKNYFSKRDDILSWRKASETLKDTSVFNQRFTMHSPKDTACFSQEFFFKLLKEKGNFYSAYYYHYTNSEVESFQWFVIDSKTKKLYIQSVEN